MEVTLIIIVGVLFVLAAIVGVKGRRGRRATREQDQAKGDVRAREGEAQQERSQARQAGVRAAYAEGAPKVDSETDE